MLKIEEGKFYRTRDGQKVGPISRGYRGFNFWVAPDLGGSWSACWHEDGSYWPEGHPYRTPVNAGYDLVAEWTDEPTGPVRTRTVTEIEPGTYGRIEVTGTYKQDRVTLQWQGDSIHDAVPIVGMNAAELRAAAAVFTQLADALDQQS